MSANKRTFKEELWLVLQGYKVLFKIDKKFLWLPLINATTDAIFPFVNLYMSARILTELTENRDMKVLGINIIITILFNMVLSVIGRYVKTKENVYLDDWWNKINLFFNDINNDMQYAHIENPETHILREKILQVQNTVGGGLASLYWNISVLVQSLFTIIFSVSLSINMFTLRAAGDFTGIAGLINSPYSVIIIVALILANTSINMICSKNEMVKTGKAFEDMAQTSRLVTYYSGSIFNFTGAMDIKIYKQAPIILEQVKKWGENAPYLKIAEKITYKYRNIKTVLNAAVNIVIYIYVAIKAFIGAFGIGQFLQYTGCINRFVYGVSGLISIIGDYKHNNVYLKDIIEYINIPNEMHTGSLSIEKKNKEGYEIEFKNVSFQYPTAEVYSLKNVSFKIQYGEKIAVVGLNGSGKTTMIKLLCRLYDPTEGEITLNGVNIKEYRYQEYLNLFSVVFQDFNLFSFSLGQNIATAMEYDAKRVEKCLEEAGFMERFYHMPNGLETALYKNFDKDGVDISGGEAQKLALARALYKDAPFIVLDEPTAALDPIAEFEIYSKFNEILSNKSAIFISHRLSSCRFCDKIFVFDNGNLVQQGSHNTMIEDRDSKYYELWNAQAQYYQ